MNNTKILLLIFYSVLLFFSCDSNRENQSKIKKLNSPQLINENSILRDTLEINGTIEFKAPDGLMITADSYEIIPGIRYILLCHQARFSRGEYIETAKKFNALGFNCLAIDQRNGEVCNQITNETAKRAKKQKMKCGYLDAMQDIIAAINYIHKKSGQKIILLGSSYSASLALLIGNKNENIEAVIAFSPGEYFDGINLKDEIKGMQKPVFVTSSKAEANQVSLLMEGVIANKSIFAPTADGDHGSKVLWGSNGDSKNEYWNALKRFLGNLH